MASLTAVTIRSWSISTSSGSTASGDRVRLTGLDGLPAGRTFHFPFLQFILETGHFTLHFLYFLQHALHAVHCHSTFEHLVSS